MLFFLPASKKKYKEKKKKKLNNKPEQPRHGMAAYVVQGCVVLVLLSVRCVRVQAVPELRVALIQLPGQCLVAAHQRLAELGGRVAHCGSCGRSLNARLDLSLPPPPPVLPPPFTAGHNLKQHGSAFFFPAHKRATSRRLIGGNRATQEQDQI